MKNRALVPATLLMIVLSGCFLHAAQVLTQQDVIKLLELKIPEQTIIDKVKDSGTAFVLGSEDIERLKKAGATDALIAVLQATAVPSAGTGSAAAEITDLALIIDYSGSMNAKMKDGAPKVTSAKKCMSDLIDKLPNDLNVALIIYGTNKKRGCEDIDVAEPLGPIDKTALKAKVARYNATGMTPIASSLEMAGKELMKSKGGPAIVLVTDGAESCHGDPAGVAAKLAAQFGVKFGINVIGFGIEPQEKAQLADIASKGRGKLLTVENANELASALQKVVTEKIAATPSPTARPIPTPKPTATPTPRATKQYEAGGEAIKPGMFFGDAPVVKPGDYKGELPMKEAKYYQVMLRKGQELRAVGIIQKTPYEGNNKISLQTFAIAIYNKDLVQVAREKMDVEESPTDPATIRATWTADISGAAYIAISASDNHEKHGHPVDVYKPKDPAPSPYTLKVKVGGETTDSGEAASSIARAQTSGGAGLNVAAELKPPVLATSDLKIGENAFYKFPVKKGDVVQASAVFQKPWYNAGNQNIKATYTLTLYDDDQVQVAQKKVEVPLNPPDAQALAVSWPATMNGNAYVSVALVNSGSEIYPKTFQPNAGRLSVQVTTEGAPADSATETGSPAEGEASPPAATATTSPSQKKNDPFSGAESSSGVESSPSSTPH
jgi:von Willebrand factor type A domain-containing protein